MQRKAKNKAAILSAVTATITLGAGHQLYGQTLPANIVANWSADNYTASNANITDPYSGQVGTNVGTNTLLSGFFGTHSGINISSGGFTLPKTAAGGTPPLTPPTGLTSFTVATTFEPTAAQVTNGAAWQVPDFLGYDIGGAGKADFGLGFGGATGLSFVAGGGDAKSGNDYTLTSAAVAVNVVHSAVFQAEDAGGVAGAGSVSLFVDGALVGSQSGLTILPMNPANAGTNFGLAGNSGGNKPTLIGILGAVQVYNDSAGVTNGAALSDLLVTGYGGTSNLYTFNTTNGSFTAGSSYLNGASPLGNTAAAVEVSNGGTATLGSADSLTIASLVVGDSAFGSGGGTVTQAGGVLNVTNALSIGRGGVAGAYNLTGGNFNYSGSGQVTLVGTAAIPVSVNVGGGAGTAQFLINTGTNDTVTDLGEGTGSNAVLNILPGGSYTTTAGEVWVGNDGGLGVVNVSGGTLSVNNWLAPGRAGGTGTINITGGLLQKTGNGNIDIAGDGANSHGYIYQTGGVLTSTSTVLITENNTSEVAVWNMSNGSVANVDSVLVGTAGNGTLNVNGSTFNATGGTNSSVGGDNSNNTNGRVGAVGVLNITNGGVVSFATDQLFIGNSGSTGTVNISGGTLSIHSWLAPGRTGGTGTIYLSSGAINVTQNNIFTDPNTGYNSVNLNAGLTDIGGDGASTGYFYQTGGTFNSPNAVVYLGENGPSVGTWNISGGTAILPSSPLTPTNFLTSLTIGLSGSGTVNLNGTGSLTAGNTVVAQNGGSTGVFNIASSTAVASATQVLVGQAGTGTLNFNAGQFNTTSVTIAADSSSTGTVNLSGGTLTTTGIAFGSGTASLTLGGTVIKAGNDNSDFLSATEGTTLSIGSGLTIDSQANKIGIQQSLSGTGPLTKLGAGTLTLAASNSYAGGTLINAGTLKVNNPNALGAGAAVLATGSTLALGTQSTTLQSFANAYKTNQSNVFLPVASGNDNAVTIVAPQNSVSTSVFLSDNQIVTVDDTLGFIANFTYNHASQGPEQTGADGIAFVLQNGSPTAGGGAGGSLGYNASGFSSSIATAVDLFLDRVDIGSGNGSSGALTNVPAENSSSGISTTTSSNVAVIYTPGASGSPGTLSITMTNSSGGIIASNSSSIDAAVALGGSAGGTAPAYIGFTGASGAANDLQSISDFSFNQLGTTLSYTAVNISNTVMVSDSASATIQLAPTAGFSSGQVGPIVLGNKSNLAITVGSSPAAGVTHGVLTTTSVTQTVGGSGTLDIGNNALDITGQSREAVRALVKTGFNGGAWNGSGITSSAAANDTTHLTAVGVILNTVDGTPTGAALYGSGTALGLFEGVNPATTDVLVKYTYFGDANLDGKVDGSDYTRIDSGFLNHTTGWYNGDFNYDGVVNGSDYTLIDNAFNRQTISLADQVATATAQVAGGGSAVPEPTTLSLLTIGAAGLLGRRRRHH